MLTTDFKVNKKDHYTVQFNQYEVDNKLKDSLTLETDIEFTKDDIDSIIKSLQQLKVILSH